QTVPTVKDENLQGLFNRANILRMKCEFDKAEEIYEKILQASESEAEAYWGLILCKYGIEYIEDPVTYKRIPTCHRTSYDAVTADFNYKSATQYADAVQKGIYEAEAKAIDAIQKGILDISQNEEPYDVFICYKESDASGSRTVDSVIANDIYYELTQEGFKVFYAAITLEDHLGSEYEPYIFSALNTAKVMLVLGTKPEYFSAVWVKNEWFRFMKLMKTDRSKLLIPCYRDMHAYELPEEFAHLQAQDMSKIGFITDLIRGIKKVLMPDGNGAKKEDAVATQQPFGNATVTALLDRGNMALEDEEWEKADEYFEQVLNMDAKCGDAYLGKVLAANNSFNLELFVESRLAQYKDVKRQIYKACDTDKETIAHVVCEYAVENFLPANKIKELFQYDLSYESVAESRQKDYDTEHEYLAQDNLINRALQFLKDDKKSAFTSAIEQINAELLQRVENAKQENEEKKETIIAAYKQFIDDTVQKVEAMSSYAKEQIEKSYQEACEAQASASFATQYDVAAEKFDKLGKYKDAEERGKECRQKATNAWDEYRQKAAKKRWLKTIVVVVCCIAIVALYLATGIMKRNRVHQAMIGETFTGAISTGSIKQNDKYTITIIDEKRCSIICVGKVYTCDDNASYTLDGGLLKITFNWESDMIESSKKPFEVTFSEDKIEMYTSEFYYYNQLRLS
ncbi:MAG: toll/interleukin-1 receptor domain-containing protein, partial [Lachnospiraceae bacterium]|nr:toll/interleukin-1 receptor domain-containing protein [Lachnospiraceae bacterium]